MTDELRRWLLGREALEVLVEAGGPVPAGKVIEQVAQRVELNGRELSRYENGRTRYDTIIRLMSGRMSVAGWIDKTTNGWVITSAGRAALREFHGSEFKRRLDREYRLRSEVTVGNGSWNDQRWHVVRTAVEMLPEGAWTAYKDLADLVGVPARTIGTFLSTVALATAHRVLTVEGQIAPEFRWADPARTDDPRELLVAEGVVFDQAGRASQEQRVTVDELRDLVGVPAAGARAWLVRGSAVSGVNVVGQWLSDGFMSLAASHLRRLDPDTGFDELRTAVETDYAHLSYNQRKAKLAELHAFLNRMQVGDAIATTSEGRVYVGRIAGEVAYAEPADPRTTIRRAVEWDTNGIDFAELPEPLQARLKSAATVVDLTDVAESVEALLGDTAAPVEPPALREATLPDLPSAVADRLLVDGAWLHEFVDLLRTRRQVVLYGPPGTGKTYLALEVANAVTDPANVKLVQFHPAYSYEDFFEGYRPATVDDTGRVGFALTPGPFRKVVDRAREDPGTPYVLVIDEINRANLAKVFGELYFLLEYRDRSIDLMYASGDPGDQGRDFTLPKNVYVIGTMNTADRSIALVDTAMRRRFAFLSLHPDDPHMRGVLRRWLHRAGLTTLPADLLDALNARVPDRDFKVGPSYLMRAEVASDEGLDRIWRTSILPLLEELHYGDESVAVAERYGLPTLRRLVTGVAADPPDEAEPAP